MLSRFRQKNKVNGVLQCHAKKFDNAWSLSFQLRRDNIIMPASEWLSSSHPGAEWLLDLIKINDYEGAQCVHEDSVELPVEVFMSEFQGQESYLRGLLNLPALFDGGIHLESQGLLSGDNYKLSFNWLNANGRPIIQAERQGIFILVGSKTFLLPWHAWKMAESLEGVQSSIADSETMYSRLEILEDFKTLKKLMPEEEQSKFSENSTITNLKLHYANAFRIEAIPEEFGFKIRPVLLKRRENQNSETVAFENILPPSEQRKYADNFSNSTQLLPYYNLGVGKYLIISEHVNKALSIVHKIQHASMEERLIFLKNPKAAIAASLDGLIDEEDLDQIFSDRVVGIGEWSVKVIPWMQMRPSDWIPGGELPDVLKGIDVGGKKITWKTPKDAQELLQKVDDAKKEGSLFIEHQGIQIPVNDNTRAAIAKLIPRKPVNPKNQTEVDDLRIKQTPIMLVKENLENLEFVPHREPRTCFPSSKGIPHSVRTTPKPHQVVAFDWLCQHYKVGSRGVLLADDMGLGKTFQSLMFYSWLRAGIENGELSEKPLLIVAPTGLLKNWEAEIDLHLMRDLGNIVKVYGSELKRLSLGQALNTAKLQNAGLVLTTYDTLTRYQTSFGVVSFTAVIFDEMQRLKNPGIQNYTAACSLNCDFWIGMTGTPVENRLCDLWAITDVLQPGMLGSIKDFSNKYEKSMLDLDDAARQEIIKELQTGLTHPLKDAPAFMLRRMKNEELPGLPLKQIHPYRIQMPAEQVKAYNDVLSNVFNSESRKGVMLEALQKLRAYSLHPDYKRQKNYVSDDDYIKQSARLMACFEILDGIYKKKQKALIFIEYQDWHKRDFLVKMIKIRYLLKEDPMIINGQVSSAARQERVTDFQSRRGIFDVMLLSPRAGGVGITLTAANHVIHLTRWWNPAVEDQANDRVYRIGQELPVHIYYLMAIHPDIPSCFDHILDQLLNKKRTLSQDVLIALPNEEGILDTLIGETFKTNQPSEFSLKESYVIGGVEYQDFVYQRLDKLASQHGFQVCPALKTRDRGADMFIETTDGELVAIIQCKSVSSADKSAKKIGYDLDRAVIDYDCADNLRHIKKIGITNASKSSREDKNWLIASDHHFIIYGEQGLKPEVLFRYLNS